MTDIFSVNLELIDGFAAIIFQYLNLDCIQYILNSKFGYIIVEQPLKLSLMTYDSGTEMNVIAISNNGIVLIFFRIMVLVSDHYFVDINHILLCLPTNNYISC